ncbi:bifunctional WD40-repeat-containing domain superfamily/WD repeat-containing protein WDR46-Utp7/WD40 repeat/WD40-YVTN repeat-like-containing domain superfamily/BING4 [Babesia duncani]|uniref:Bifunctional WD40-repeat-containing domain superfamily/WD repeat-containing protein WDR46-Utp7/WD40 repeat/WD40-YVTN repeat-like-containing domain superfamily/BING4 n=1 Tax=Babesia duncani TaxID=323732 RepID=A0AAD9PJN0_9APIC|nr:bifunctional WD40-repeat-containing domain superfamily/WD repeat-containing protein WDR46-Utp7/WD40 repeat/WD40-YVTN repeat-like-containing domain superfamily/BING4 [Babesia duncani]
MANIIGDTKFLHKRLFGGKAEKKKESFAKKNITKQKKLLDEAKDSIDKCSILLPNDEGYIRTDDGEKSFKLTQAKLLENVDVGTLKKAITLELSHGPYHVDYSHNGRYMLIGGEKGHLSLIDMHTTREHFEIPLKETIRDVRFLHSHEMVAAAQKKYVYIYDNRGSEVYCLRERMLTYKLEYLQYHYLLVGIGEFGELWYQDVSTGEVITTHKTKRGACKVMRQNKSNAVIHLGHTDGLVSLWTPNIAKACVKMLAHKGPVTAIAIYDNYMVTGGYDGFWKLWDLRNYSETLAKDFVGHTPPSCMDVSQSGILGMSYGGRVEFYKNIFSGPNSVRSNMYLSHALSSQTISGIRFQPYEDVVAIGSSFGVSTLIVPGSGFANFDSMEENPYINDRNRQIQRLLDKLPADSITLNKAPLGSYNRELALDDPESNVQELAESGKKKLKHKGKRTKVKQYNRTFARRQQAIADRIKFLKQRGKVDGNKILTDMTQEAPDGTLRPLGSVRGAALSRYYNKK